MNGAQYEIYLHKMSGLKGKYDICCGSENLPVLFADDTLQEKLPEDYVCCNIPGPGFGTDQFEELLAGCACAGKSCDLTGIETCTCQSYGSYYNGDKGLIDKALSRFSTVIIQECNSNCPCSGSCNNRVVQNGIQVRLEMIYDPLKGFGVRTLEEIRKGQFVCEYAGDIIPETEARKRLKTLKDGDMNYVFVLREHVASGVIGTYIDPRYRGNIGRFINHSCEPNLTVVPARVQNIVPRVCLFAVRDIRAGEELAYDYSQTGDDDRSKSTLEDIPGKKRCYCGSKTCNGFLPSTDIVY